MTNKKLLENWNKICKCEVFQIMQKIVTVTSMRATFSGCTNLITAPEIPESVENLQNTFQKCSSLTGTITIER